MNWLDQLLKEAGITPAELSRRSFLNEGLISRIRKGKIRATTDTLKAIAKGLDLPVDKVYRAAGELPAETRRGELENELVHIFEKIPTDDGKRIALRLLQAYIGESDPKGIKRSIK